MEGRVLASLDYLYLPMMLFPARAACRGCLLLASAASVCGLLHQAVDPAPHGPERVQGHTA
eukprot:6184519-Pleurochrysis_carterae.AAC.1